MAAPAGAPFPLPAPAAALPELRCHDNDLVGLGDPGLINRIQGTAAARSVPFNVTLELTLNCNIR